MAKGISFFGLVNFKNKLKFPEKSIGLLYLSLICSALSNLFIWKYNLIFDKNIFRASIIDIFKFITPEFGSLILFGNISSLYLLKFKKYRFIPFLFISLSQFIFLNTNNHGYHHSVFFSSVVFLIVSIALFYKDKSLGFLPLSIVVATTYFIAGISKFSEPTYFNGQIISKILSKGILPPHFLFKDNIWPLTNWFSPFLTQISYLSVILEMFLLPISIFLIQDKFKFTRLIIALPFHLFLFCTGRGAIFHLLIPALLLMQFESLNSDNSSNFFLSQKIIKSSTKLFSFLSCYYIIYMIVRYFLKG